MDEGAAKGMCRRCLLRDMAAEAPLYEVIRQTVDAIDADHRADLVTYRARLDTCGACGHLYGGMCVLCGCYVEVRAAWRVRRCPNAPPRWEALPNGAVE